MGRRRAGAADFHADEDQVQEIVRYAAQIGEEVEILEPELDVSGGKPIEERPSLKAAIEGVENGAYTGVVAAYLSRLTRSRSGIEIWDRVEAAGGHVHCAHENLDTSTPSGRFVRDIHLANAVREREERAADFERRAQHATEAGIWQRRQTPTGYLKAEDRRLAPDDRADDVLRAFEDYAARVPLTQIAARLGMTTSGARQLLRNRVYLGELRVRSYVNENAHPPIVPRSLFDQVQRLQNVRGPRAETAPALLAGLVRCASCSHVMSRARSGGTSVYACHGHSSAGPCPGRAIVTLDRLDRHTERIALHELERVQLAHVETDTTQIREQVQAVEDQIARYLRVVTQAGVDEAESVQVLRDLQGQLDDLRAEETRANRRVPLGADPAGLWEKMDTGQRNRLLRSLFEAVVVWPAHGRTLPVHERVTVLRLGAGVIDPARGGGKARGIVGVRREDIRPAAVAGMELREDGLKGAGR